MKFKELPPESRFTLKSSDVEYIKTSDLGQFLGICNAERYETGEQVHVGFEFEVIKK